MTLKEVIGRIYVPQHGKILLIEFNYLFSKHPCLHGSCSITSSVFKWFSPYGPHPYFPFHFNPLPPPRFFHMLTYVGKSTYPSLSFFTMTSLPITLICTTKTQ